MFNPYQYVQQDHLVGDDDKDISNPCMRHDDDVHCDPEHRLGDAFASINHNAPFHGDCRSSRPDEDDGAADDEEDTDDVIQDDFSDLEQSVDVRSCNDRSIDVGLVQDVSGRLLSDAATSSLLNSIPDNCDSLSDSNHSSEPEAVGHLLDNEEEWMQSFYCDFEEFLRMVVPSKLTSSSEVGWILLPYTPYRDVPSDEEHTANVSGLHKEWKRLLENNTPVNFPLIRNLAVKHQILTGKWMIFPRHGVHADLTWIIIARAHEQGKLGLQAKISTSQKDELNKSHVICVYSDDFTDTKDVFELESKLRDVGIRCRMLYKPDVFTYCNIYSKNKWKMRPYIYTSIYDIKTKQSIIEKEYDYDYGGGNDDHDHYVGNDHCGSGDDDV